MQGPFSLCRARSNIDELYYQNQAGSANQSANLIPAAISEEAPQEAGIFSLCRARSNIDELYYQDQADQAGVASELTNSIPAISEEEPEEAAISVVFALSRVRSNIDALYYQDQVDSVGASAN